MSKRLQAADEDVGGHELDIGSSTPSVHLLPRSFLAQTAAQYIRRRYHNSTLPTATSSTRMSLVSSSLLRLPRHCRRSFATTSHLSAGCTGPVTSRAIVYAEHGDPQVVLRGHTYTLRALEKGEVRVRFELAAFSACRP